MILTWRILFSPSFYFYINSITSSCLLFQSLLLEKNAHRQRIGETLEVAVAVIPLFKLKIWKMIRKIHVRSWIIAKPLTVLKIKARLPDILHNLSITYIRAMSHKFLSLGMISTSYFYDEHADLSIYQTISRLSSSQFSFSHGFQSWVSWVIPELF